MNVSREIFSHWKVFCDITGRYNQIERPLVLLGEAWFCQDACRSHFPDIFLFRGAMRECIHISSERISEQERVMSLIIDSQFIIVER